MHEDRSDSEPHFTSTGTTQQHIQSAPTRGSGMPDDTMTTNDDIVDLLEQSNQPFPIQRSNSNSTDGSVYFNTAHYEGQRNMNNSNRQDQYIANLREQLKREQERSQEEMKERKEAQNRERKESKEQIVYLKGEIKKQQDQRTSERDELAKKHKDLEDRERKVEVEERIGVERERCLDERERKVEEREKQIDKAKTSMQPQKDIFKY